MSKRKLLLADDSITIQKVVNLTFADEGIEVVTAGDGDAAMQRFVEIKPDLVMVDVNMPGMDGYRICELIKQDDETKHIPVILLVGSFEPFDEEEARRVGADDYLTKPFQSIRQLVNKVSVLLDSAKAKEDLNNQVIPVSVNEYAKAEQQTFDQPAAGNLGDAGMDDEMIQTNQIGSPPAGEAQKFEASSFANESLIDFSRMPIRKPLGFDVENPLGEEEDVSKTQPLTAADFNEITLKAMNANTERVFELADEPEFSRKYPTDEMKVSEEKTADSQTFPEETLAEKNRYAPTQEKQEPFSTSRPTSLLDFDELDLLELPMFEEEEVSSDIEQAEVSSDFAETMPEPMPEIPETSATMPEPMPEVSVTQETFEKMPETTPESVEIPKTSATSETEKEDEATESSAQAMSFPPELIEAIASKVAEKISERTVREIASEVTPQMVELIIKRMAEEKMKE
ncbi:MAG: response regulator [Pyrinomonadaceae bacterium]